MLELRYGTASLAAAKTSEAKRRAATEQFWEAWAATLKLPAVHRELVLRSALVLRALSLRSDGGDRRGGDDQPAGACGGRAKLGLSLLLAAGCGDGGGGAGAAGALRAGR